MSMTYYSDRKVPLTYIFIYCPLVDACVVAIIAWHRKRTSASAIINPLSHSITFAIAIPHSNRKSTIANRYSIFADFRHKT